MKFVLNASTRCLTMHVILTKANIDNGWPRSNLCRDTYRYNVLRRDVPRFSMMVDPHDFRRPRMNETLRVPLAERSYDIVITNDSLSRIGAFARGRSKSKTALVITDENASVHAAPIQTSLADADFRTSLVVRPA